jgi:hypothetical protein
MEMPYLLRKHGMWYAHNSCGYTNRAELAELYTKEYAERHAESCDEVTAIPVNQVIESAEDVEPYITRLEVIRDALESNINT